MGTVKKIMIFYAALLLVSALSSFTIVTADDSSKSEEHSAEKDASVSDDNSQEDSKEKRSREEILFGNQQNKPSGLVDDLMGMSDNEDDTEENESSKDGNQKINSIQGQKVLSSKEDDDTKTTQEDSNDMMMGSGTDNWYNTVPVSSSQLQHLLNPPTLHTMPSTDYSNSLYDREDLYRRKRQLLGHPMPLRKRRSLRSSLGQMIQKRGLRMPRRSMRLKRQVEMEDLLSLLGNDGYYDEQQQVPGHFSAYPETPALEFRYPFTFKHRGDGVLTPGNDFDDNKSENLDNDDLEDIESLMLLHPRARYVEAPEIGIIPYRSDSRDDDESQVYKKWLARHTTPNILTVSRRSPPNTFYPLNYRYIPVHKKRSRIFSNGNRIPNGYSGDMDDTEPDLGKWGHIVQVPEAYPSAEDVARLYGLANIMGEGDEEAKMRRSV